MRGKSHRTLGLYLSQQYMQDVPKHCVQAFLIGCIEPDRNPITYLKGSIRCQWLRGHNYLNARRFMRRISWRLENRASMNIWDYYTLGKLIHYTADAFTYAHNLDFPSNLADHMEYEKDLQDHFLAYLQEDPKVDTSIAKTTMEAIYTCPRQYEQSGACIFNDSRYALQACCCVVALLLVKPLI